MEEVGKNFLKKMSETYYHMSLSGTILLMMFSVCVRFVALF
jgi:hypothetical protein